MKKIIVLLLLCAFLLLTGCQRAGGTLNVRVFSIGQADCILLADGDVAVLIDTGEKDDGEQIADALRAHGIKALDLLVLTHFDKDHIGGAPELLSRVPVERVIMPAYESNGKRYEKLMDALSKTDAKIDRPAEDTALTIGTLTLDLWTAKASHAITESEEDIDNDQSLVVKIGYGNARLLFLADAEDARTKELLNGGYDLSCDVLKIPHHGRHHETSDALLDATSPGYALITDSKKNPADAELLALLDARNIRTMRTIDGDLVLTVQGGRIMAAIDD